MGRRVLVKHNRLDLFFIFFDHAEYNNLEEVIKPKKVADSINDILCARTVDSWFAVSNKGGKHAVLFPSIRLVDVVPECLFLSDPGI